MLLVFKSNAINFIWMRECSLEDWSDIEFLANKKTNFFGGLMLDFLACAYEKTILSNSALLNTM